MWPLKTKEKRSAVDTSDYSAVVIDQWERRATGDLVDPEQLASVQAAIGLIQRSFESAEFAGSQTAIDRLKPLLPWIAGRMALRGECFLYLDDDGNVLPSTLIEISGDPGDDPVYKLNLISPNGRLKKITTAGANVLALISRPSLTNPWRGVSPVQESGLTGSSAAFLERFFEVQSRQFPITLVTFPKHLGTDQSRGVAKNLFHAASRGVPAVFGASDSGGLTPSIQSSAHLGGQTSGADLRRDLASDLTSLVGVPRTLLNPGTGGGNAIRESLRFFHRTTLRAMASVIEKEVRKKTDLTLAISFANAAVVDHQAQARAMRQYIESGLTLEQAAFVLGIKIEERPDGA